MNTTNKTVCHITTVHTVKDTRIYHKECRALAEAGYKVYLVAVNAQTTESDYDNVHIINVPWEFKSKLERMIKAPKMARAAAESLNADVYHFHDPEFLFQAKKMADKGLKVIYDAHEDVPKQVKNKAWIPTPMRYVVSRMVAAIEMACVRKISAVVTVVDSIEERMKRYNPKVVQVRNYPSLSELPAPAPWREKRNETCYVGDLTTIRGAEQMVAAMDFKNARLVLAGRFASDALKERVKSLSGWKQTTYLGFIDRGKVKEVYAKAKVGLVVLHPTPSYVDAIPVKMLEYMAAGIPFVGSNFGFIKEVVQKHACGILVDPLNDSAIAEAVQHLLNNDELARTMGEKGRRVVEECYDWDSEKVKLLNLYQEMMYD